MDRLQVGAGEDLSNRESVGREVVISKCARLVGVIEDAQPPGSRRRPIPLRNECEFGVDSPRGAEIVGDLLLQSVNHRLNVGVGQHCAGIDYGYLNRADLRH